MKAFAIQVKARLENRPDAARFRVMKKEELVIPFDLTVYLHYQNFRFFGNSKLEPLDDERRPLTVSPNNRFEGMPNTDLNIFLLTMIDQGKQVNIEMIIEPEFKKLRISSVPEKDVPVHADLKSFLLDQLHMWGNDRAYVSSATLARNGTDGEIYVSFANATYAETHKHRSNNCQCQDIANQMALSRTQVQEQKSRLAHERGFKNFKIEERKFFLPNMLTRDAMICVLNVMPFEDFLEMRLVSKAWNSAAMNCYWHWNNLLKKEGPRMIGPNSIHKDTRRCDRVQTCKDVKHYTNLAPRYTKGGYQRCMEWLSEKYLQKGDSLLSRKISLEATLHHIKRREAELEMELSQRLQDLKRREAELEMEFSQRLQVTKIDRRKQEQRFRRATKEHERFLKNKKAKKSE